MRPSVTSIGDFIGPLIGANQEASSLESGLYLLASRFWCTRGPSSGPSVFVRADTGTLMRKQAAAAPLTACPMLARLSPSITEALLRFFFFPCCPLQLPVKIHTGHLFAPIEAPMTGPSRPSKKNKKSTEMQLTSKRFPASHQN